MTAAATAIPVTLDAYGNLNYVITAPQAGVTHSIYLQRTDKNGKVAVFPWSEITTPVDGTQSAIAAIDKEAKDAAAQAALALAGLGQIGSDNLLAKSEKVVVISDYTSIIAEQTGLDNQANTYDTIAEMTVYDDAVTSLTTFLTTAYSSSTGIGVGTGGQDWENTDTDSTINGVNFQAAFKAVYDSKQTLILAMLDAARVIAVGGSTNGHNLIANGQSDLGPLAGVAGDGIFDTSNIPSGLSFPSGYLGARYVRAVNLGYNSWLGATHYSIGDIVQNEAVVAGVLQPLGLFRCTTAGTSAAVGNTWDGPYGSGSITDGTVVWQCLSLAFKNGFGARLPSSTHPSDPYRNEYGKWPQIIFTDPGKIHVAAGETYFVGCKVRRITGAFVPAVGIGNGSNSFCLAVWWIGEDGNPVHGFTPEGVDLGVSVSFTELYNASVEYGWGHCGTYQGSGTVFPVIFSGMPGWVAGSYLSSPPASLMLETYCDGDSTWYVTDVFVEKMPLLQTITTASVVGRTNLGPIALPHVINATPTVTGSTGGNAALASLIAQLAAQGIIVDSTT